MAPHKLDTFSSHCTLCTYLPPNQNMAKFMTKLGQGKQLALYPLYNLDLLPASTPSLSPHI